MNLIGFLGIYGHRTPQARLIPPAGVQFEICDFGFRNGLLSDFTISFVRR
jgi:hypothetical protein